MTYRPSADTLSVIHLNATTYICNNIFLGLTPNATINFGTLANYNNMKCTGNWPTRNILSAITPSLVLHLEMKTMDQ